MAFAGQSCIAVQRCIVHESLVDDFTELLLEAVSRLPVGDPLHPETIVGPMIDEAAAQRVASSISVALDAGAQRLTPAGLSGSVVAPTVLRGVDRAHSLWADEAFAPTLALATYSRMEDLVEVMNEGRFGLQAGVFTREVQTAFWLHRELELGGLIIGDVPTFRADQMAYGGVKDSGVGREGVASAMDDFTDPSVLVFSNVAL
jgi:acyl-CoA reductase-like NAD-dependent aldehyde dehydrogenase